MVTKDNILLLKNYQKGVTFLQFPVILSVPSDKATGGAASHPQAERTTVLNPRGEPLLKNISDADSSPLITQVRGSFITTSVCSPVSHIRNSVPRLAELFFSRARTTCDYTTEVTPCPQQAMIADSPSGRHRDSWVPLGMTLEHLLKIMACA